MTSGCRDRRGVALLFALVVVVLLEGLAALALSATLSRSRLVGAGRAAVDGRGVATHALAVTRVQYADTLVALTVGDTLRVTGIGPVDGWRFAVEATRIWNLVVLRALAEFRPGEGGRSARQTATLLLWRGGADTLLVIDRFPRW